ncbi:MAG TPA: DUF3306 domain-containing protein [Halomonas sp.]|nr:DUF3306 domain-containing protein [Halomonas sp.]
MSRLERWSRRKLSEDTKAADASDDEHVVDTTLDAESGDSVDATSHDGDAGQVSADRDEPPAPGSLDATLPDPESLAPGSDIKAFLEPGVSTGLRRRALRRLFAGDKYGIRDGLDDYDHDYREILKPLASDLAQRMRKWTVPAEKSPEALEEEQRADEVSNGEAPSSPDQPEEIEAQDKDQEQEQEQDEKQGEEQDERPASDESMASVESRQLDDAPMLDQGRGGSRHQSGQD